MSVTRLTSTGLLSQPACSFLGKLPGMAYLGDAAGVVSDAWLPLSTAELPSAAHHTSSDAASSRSGPSCGQASSHACSSASAAAHPAWSSALAGRSFSQPQPHALHGQRRHYSYAATARQSPPDAPLDITALLASAGEMGSRGGRSGLTPAAIVSALDAHIVGQPEAKRAVAVALRNRWRRQQVGGPMRDEIMPKNILLVGPTGCGKTEIARRLAKLADAPFVKVEASRFTELGYVGRDVDEIVKDLAEASMALTRTRLRTAMQVVAARVVEDVILRALVGPQGEVDTFRESYQQGKLDDTPVEVEIPPMPPAGDGPAGLAAGGGVSLERIFSAGMGRPDITFGNRGSARGEKKRMSVAEARAKLEEVEVSKAMQGEALAKEAVRCAEQDGIVFIDEIDKIVESSSGRSISGGVSSEGVQRDLLPIIEGSSVTTKYGPLCTDHVLFICSGAFHTAKPSDMLAELQGRLPIRVTLKGLTAADFHRILTEPASNLVRQQQALLACEGVDLTFSDAALRAMARLAEEANTIMDNIGARRLHTVMERLMSELSFRAPELVAEARSQGRDRHTHHVDEAAVEAAVAPLLKRQDLSKYII